jgi:hypothetical protein
MIKYELQLNNCFHYVSARSEAEAVAKLLASLRASERFWANVIPTGRNR